MENIQWQRRLNAHALQPDAPIIQLLIHGGASLTAKNERGLTPLLQSLQKGDQNEINIKTIASYSKKEEINEVDREGCNALHYIAKMRNTRPAFQEEVTHVRLGHNNLVAFNIFTSASAQARC